VAASAGFALVPQTCFADLISFQEYSLKNNTGQTADDFEIWIGTGNIVKFKLTQGDFQYDTSTLPSQSLMLNNGLVGNGGSIGFTIGLKDFDGKSFYASWTYDGKKIGSAFTVSQSVSSVFLGGGLSSATYALTNPSTNSVNISDLAFATGIASFDMFTQDPSALTYGAPMNFALAGGQSADISLGDVAAGSLVVARGIADSGDGSPENFFAGVYDRNSRTSLGDSCRFRPGRFGGIDICTAAQTPVSRNTPAFAAYSSRCLS
jgi:hypothetical protein